MEDNNNKLKYIEDLRKIDENEEQIKNIVNAFSKYISVVNSDYKYNETYLEQYIDGFMKFKEKLEMEETFFMKLLSAFQCSDGDIEFRLDDSFRAIVSQENDKLRIQKNFLSDINNEKIMSDDIEVWCKIKVENKGKLFYKTYKEDKQNLNDIVIELQNFLKEKRNEKIGKGANGEVNE